MRRFGIERLQVRCSAGLSFGSFREVVLLRLPCLYVPEFTGVRLYTAYKKIFCPVSRKENHERRCVKTFRFSHLTF